MCIHEAMIEKMFLSLLLSHFSTSGDHIRHSQILQCHHGLNMYGRPNCFFDGSINGYLFSVQNLFTSRQDVLQDG